MQSQPCPAPNGFVVLETVDATLGAVAVTTIRALMDDGFKMLS